MASPKIINKHLGPDLPLWGILALAFTLRIVAINFGLPHLYHADETIVVNHALAYGTGDFNPHFFKIPPLVSYLLFVAYGLYYGIGCVFGIFGGISDFQELIVNDPTSFYLLGRIVFGVFLGTLSLYVLYRLIKKFVTMEHALLSAFFFAVSF